MAEKGRSGERGGYWGFWILFLEFVCAAGVADGYASPRELVLVM
jgi:hypothetical protein